MAKVILFDCKGRMITPEELKKIKVKNKGLDLIVNEALAQRQLKSTASG